MKKLFITLLVLLQVVATPLLVVAQTTPAVLYFSPPGESASTGTVNINSASEFSVDVKVNTHGSNSAGADVIVTYDTTKLQYVSGSMPGSGSGSFYPTVVKGAPASNTTGRISMARVIQAPDEGSSPVYTNGDGVFANLVFKPLASSPVGTTVNLSFDYTAGSTTDCNVAGTTTSNPDILGNAKNATLTIQQGPSPTVLDSVSIAPASSTVAPSGTQALTATAKDSTGATISSGVTFAWTITGVGSLGSTSGSSVTYTAGSSTGSASVGVTATQSSVTKTGTATVTVSSTPSNDPVIDRIAPSEGEDTGTVEIVLYGNNFGTANGRVYVGGRQADISSWGNTQVVIIVPKLNATRNTEYLVRLVTDAGKEAVYMGYLAKTGLPLLPWLLMFPMNGAAALWVKRRWLAKR